MTRSEKTKILTHFLAGQPSRLLEFKRLLQLVNNEFLHLNDEELEALIKFECERMGEMYIDTRTLTEEQLRQRIAELDAELASFEND